MNVEQIVLPVLMVGLTTVLLIVGLGRIKLTRQFAWILAMVIASALQIFPWFRYVPLVGDFTEVPNALPSFSLPNFSMIFQLIWWYGGGLLIGLMWLVVGALSAILIGVILIPIAIVVTLVLALLPLGAVIYGIVAAIQVNQGHDFKYWLVGDWVRSTLTGQ